MHHIKQNIVKGIQIWYAKVGMESSAQYWALGKSLRHIMWAMSIVKLLCVEIDQSINWFNSESFAAHSVAQRTLSTLLFFIGSVTTVSIQIQHASCMVVYLIFMDSEDHIKRSYCKKKNKEKTSGTITKSRRPAVCPIKLNYFIEK